MRSIINIVRSFIRNTTRLGKPLVSFLTIAGIIIGIIIGILQFPALWRDFFKKSDNKKVTKEKTICEEVFKDSSNYRIVVLPFFKTCETGRDIGLEIKNRLQLLKYKDSLNIEVCYLDTFKQNPNFTKEQADKIRKENNADQIIYGVNSSLNCTPQDTLLEVCVNYLADEKYMVNTPVPISQVKASISEIRQGFLQADIDYVVYFFSAVSDYEKSRYKQSLYKLSKIVNNNKNGEYNYLKGLVFEQLDNVDSALANYNLAIKYDFDPSYLLARASLYRTSFSEYKLSLEDCMNVIRSTKDTSLTTQALFDISINKYLLDDFKGSIKAVETYSRYYKKTESLDLSFMYYIKGVSFKSLDKNDSALVYYNKAIEIDKNFLPPIHSRAELLVNEYDYDKALKDFNFLIQKDSINADYYVDRANLYYKLHNLEKSKKDYSKAIRMSKDSVVTYLKIAEAKRDQYNYWQSLYILKYILKRHENNYAIHHHLGITYSELHDNIQSINHYKLSSKLNPGFDDNFYNISVVCYDAGRYKDGIAEINKFLRLHPSDGKSYYWRGRLKMALNDISGMNDMKKASYYGNPNAIEYLKASQSRELLY
jgi:tetratricopeptide (TPR) repeat protein